MTALTVVAYNVLFGDAILICIPDRSDRKTVMRHVLIDVGNVLGGPDSNAGVFRTILDDIRRRLDGRPIDLYVMTHEHMDHVQGLLCAHKDGQELPQIDYAWLTASSNVNYYEQFPQATKQRSLPSRPTTESAGSHVSVGYSVSRRSKHSSITTTQDEQEIVSRFSEVSLAIRQVMSIVISTQLPESLIRFKRPSSRSGRQSTTPRHTTVVCVP
jgi:hypothetical protein